MIKNLNKPYLVFHLVSPEIRVIGIENKPTLQVEQKNIKNVQII